MFLEIKKIFGFLRSHLSLVGYWEVDAFGKATVIRVLGLNQC